ncbi:CU044_5270 family protein [Actinomadura sp. DC4]|uniref:CU044_5270 family protein n=1 Tax=Actinomadura sp. DC4 TaxID=3055069 RepID=UPI0025B19ADA|nr:CU044_5270 family protein [Actinomadura sp. DC4]MDN3355153.1 CU044_5270 family protein [Actinomadura sp. DC4]
MSVEDQLAEAMRRTAGTIEPRVTELVSGGIARGRRRRLRNRVGAASAVAAVAAAAVTASVITVGGGAVTSRPPVVRLVSAAEVLNKAAQATASRRWTEPRPNQWVYTKAVGDGAAGGRPTSDESWIRVDRSQDAWFQNGKLMIRRSPDGGRGGQKVTKAILSLPRDPQSVRTQVYKIIDAEPRSDWEGRTRESQAFHTIVEWMWSNPVTIPPTLQATLYRALATIPHIAVDQNAKDGLGRPAIAVHWGGFGDQFLITPATYQMVAQRGMYDRHNAPISKTKGMDPRFNVDKGVFADTLTYVVAKVVDKPGQR